MATGDFDHDGIGDLAVTDADTATLSILLGGGSNARGDGTFAAPTSVNLKSPSVTLTQSDIDSDGVLDLIAAGSDQISVLFGQGTY